MASMEMIILEDQSRAEGINNNGAEMTDDVSPNSLETTLEGSDSLSPSLREHDEDKQSDRAKASRLEVYTQSDSSVTQEEVEDLRKNLRRFYDNPFKSCTPSNILISIHVVFQFAKALLVFFQIWYFSQAHASFEHFSQRNEESFKNIFLKVLPRTAASEPYAVYSQSDLYDHINHVLYQYYRFEDVSLAAYHRIPNDTVNMTATYYNQTELDPRENQYNINLTVSPQYEGLILSESLGENCTDTDDENCFDVRKYLEELGDPLDFARLTELRLNLVIKGIGVITVEPLSTQPTENVACVEFQIMIVYDNSRHSGEITISLNNQLNIQPCFLSAGIKSLKIGSDAMNSVVLVFCAISIVLWACAYHLRRKTHKNAKRLFKEHYNYTLMVPETLELFFTWNIEHLFSDLLVFAGTLMQLLWRIVLIGIGTFSPNRVYDVAAAILGVGAMAQIIDTLHCLGFSNRYSQSSMQYQLYFAS